MHAFDPARFDGRNQRGVRIERPVAADLALQPERFAIGRQQQFDGGGVEADAVIERGHAVRFVDAANHHHRGQHLQIADVARIAREQRLDGKRPVGLHDHVDPRAGNIDARQFIDDFVHLNNHDAMHGTRRPRRWWVCLRCSVRCRDCRDGPLFPRTTSATFGVRSTNIRA